MKVPPTVVPGLAVTSREIHVWPVILRGDRRVAALFELLLSPDEISRANAFRFEHLRRSFLLSRGALRTLAGSYMKTPPAKMKFVCGANGKPSLVQSGVAKSALHFNASHSGEMALFAFTYGCELGVDVEQTRHLDDMMSLANHFFSREEADDLSSLSPAIQQSAFFHCWTRKEAYVKAVGDGLSIPLDSFRVTLRPGEAARFLELHHDVSLAQGWTLHDLEMEKIDASGSYVAALAYRDAPRPLRLQPALEMEDLLGLRCGKEG